MFTYRNPNFGFYLTDVSPDNIAVDQRDNVKFIDMENVIVVDKRGAGRSECELVLLMEEKLKPDVII